MWMRKKWSTRKKENEMKMFYTNDKFEKWEIWCDCRRFGNRWNNINIFHIHILQFAATFSFQIALYLKRNKNENEKWIYEWSADEKKQHMNNINAICQHFSHKNTFWLPVKNGMQQHLRFHWFASYKQAICNRVDQIEIVFKTYSHCIRFAFEKLRMLFLMFFFLSLSQFRVLSIQIWLQK